MRLERICCTMKWVQIYIEEIKMLIDEIRQKIINRRNKNRSNPFTKVNSGRERSISILQKRYGYTREQATSQLDKHYSNTWLG